MPSANQNFVWWENLNLYELLVTLCTGEELCSQLMKPETPSVTKLTRIVQEYEHAQAGKQGLGWEAGGHTHWLHPRDLSPSLIRRAKPANIAAVRMPSQETSAGSLEPHVMSVVRQGTFIRRAKPVKRKQDL